MFTTWLFVVAMSVYVTYSLHHHHHHCHHHHHHLHHWKLVNLGCASLEPWNFLCTKCARAHTFPVKISQFQLFHELSVPSQSQATFWLVTVAVQNVFRYFTCCQPPAFLLRSFTWLGFIHGHEILTGKRRFSFHLHYCVCKFHGRARRDKECLEFLWVPGSHFASCICNTLCSVVMYVYFRFIVLFWARYIIITSLCG